MRGVKCSWKEMARIKQAIAAMERGDGKRYAELKCVEPGTIAKWRRTLEVLPILQEGEMSISTFSHFQPSHAEQISRAFRKSKKPMMEHAGEILDWVTKCEDEKLTVEDLRLALQKNGDSSIAKSHGLVTDLQTLVDSEAKFPTIYADPPWQYSNKATRSAVDGDNDAAYKSTMTVDEICAEPVSQLVTDKAHLHLWTTNAFLFEAKRVIEAWGFEYKSCFVWVKPQLGIGNYWRVSHEFMLLGVRGGMRFRDRSMKSWMELDRVGHSIKPRQVREAVEKVSPGPYLEMYGRDALPEPWTVYGNEIRETLFHGKEARH